MHRAVLRHPNDLRKQVRLKDVWQVEALTAFIKDLASKGLSGLYAKKEENVLLASRAIIDVCERLGELNALPNDVEKDILAFFQKSKARNSLPM